MTESPTKTERTGGENTIRSLFSVSRVLSASNRLILKKCVTIKYRGFHTTRNCAGGSPFAQILANDRAEDSLSDNHTAARNRSYEMESPMNNTFMSRNRSSSCSEESQRIRQSG